MVRVVATFVVVIVAACRPPGWGKDVSDVDAGEAAPDADDTPAPDAGPTPPDAAAVTCEQTFRLEGQGAATSIWLTGDFVGWAGNPTDGAIALELGGDAAWTATHTFDAGSYQYKFIVDGATWIADPANPDTIGDGLGGFNSVYSCE
jgi:hypothetical protein